MTGRFVRALAALIFGAAGGTVVMTSAAHASACAAGTGVTVVVNSDVRCVSGGGGTASSKFSAADFSLSNYRGFVCSIDGSPDPAKACHSFAPPDAYWALWVSDGRSGTWNYASNGAYTQTVVTGGWVAFKWQNSSTRTKPGMTPYTAPPAPAPKPKPEAKPSASVSAKPSASASASAKAAEKQAAEKKAKAKASASASASPSAPGDSTSGDDIVKTSNETDGPGGMVWVGAALAGLLIIGMGAAMWRRRLAGRQP